MTINTEEKKAEKPKHANGSSRIGSVAYLHRAKALVSEFPSNLGTRIKLKPYATLAIAGAIGMGAGVLLGSRILRAVLTTAASYAAVALARTYLREKVARDSDAVGSRLADPSLA